MNVIVKRQTIKDLWEIKEDFLYEIENFIQLNETIAVGLEAIGGWRPYHIDWQYEGAPHGEEQREKYIDRILWNYLVKLYNLHRYMLQTEYEKMKKEINEYKTPCFTIETAEGWVASLKDKVYENVEKMFKRVYETIVTGTYEVGGWNGTKKKRNNNGIDKFFILKTWDYNFVFGYRGDLTITDDLEKVCYLIDGKELPKMTLKEHMHRERLSVAENDYFKLKVCKTGNSHYTIKEPFRDKLNLIGADGHIIGENIKIKIFEEG